MDDLEIKNIWMARCADRIVKYHGKDSRPRANDAANKYIEAHGVDENPEKIADLIMEAWSY